MYKLSLKYLKYNKKNTVFTLVSIVLATLLLTLLTSIFSSAWATMERCELKKAPYHGTTGFDEKAVNSKDESMNVFKNNAVFEETVAQRYVTIWNQENNEIPWGMVEHNSSFYYPHSRTTKGTQINTYFAINQGKTSKNNYIENWFADKIEQGSMPTQKGEIAISLREANQRNLKIGDTYTIYLDKYRLKKKPTTGMDILNGGHKKSYGEEDFEKIENEKQIEYTICGFVNIEADNDNVFEYYLCNEDLQDLNDNYFKGKIYCDVYFRFVRGIKDESQAVVDAVQASEINGWEENNIYLNLELMQYELVGNHANLNLLKYIAVAIIIIAIVMVFARMVIDCAFEISAKQRVSHFGILQSVGASREQVINIIFFEALILCIVGIPFGILFGFLVSKGVFSYILKSFDFEMIARVSELPFKPYFAFPFFMIVATAVIALVWVMFSAYGTAMRFTKLSPIEAIISGGKNDKIKKPRKHSKPYSKFPALFLADRSMKRNKKRHIITSISITASMLLMVMASMMLNYMDLQMANGFEFDMQGLDPNQTNIEEVYKCFKENIDVKYANFRSFYYNRTPVSLKDENKFIKEKFKDELKYDFIPIIDEQNFYEVFGENPSISYEQFKNGEYIVADMQKLATENEKYTEVYLENYECPIKNTGTMQLCFGEDKQEELNLKIGAVEQVVDNGYLNPKSLIYTNCQSVAVICVPLEVYKQVSKMTGGEYVVMFDVFMSSQEHYGELKDGLSKLGVEIYANEGYFIFCVANIIGILAYLVIYIVFGIAMFNLINTISTGLLNRENELKILKACGQSNVSQNKMLSFESIMYSVNALIYSGIISAFFIWLIRKSMFLGIADFKGEQLEHEIELINKYIPMFGFVKPLLIFFVISVAIGFLTNVIVKKQVGETGKQMF